MINKFLEYAQANTLNRFSPVLFQQQSKKNLAWCLESLLKKVHEGVLKVNYEIECPKCGNSTLVVHKLKDIPSVVIDCRYCDEQYIPNPKRVWITFDFYKKLGVKKKTSKDTSFKLAATQTNLVELGQNNYFQNKFVPEECFHSDIKICQKHLLRIKKAITNDEKKKSLEEFADYLFDDCCTVIKICDKNKRTSTAEIDRIASVKAIPCTFLQNWGDYILVECKNWGTPANSEVIMKIGSNMEKAKCTVAMLFSKNGVTGRNGTKDAAGEITSQFDRGRTIIVITLTDIERLTKGENLLSIMEQKSREIRFTR